MTSFLCYCYGGIGDSGVVIGGDGVSGDAGSVVGDGEPGPRATQSHAEGLPSTQELQGLSRQLRVLWLVPSVLHIHHVIIVLEREGSQRKDPQMAFPWALFDC